MSGSQIFVLSIIAMVMLASIIKTSIQAKHGLSGPNGGKRVIRRLADDVGRQNELLVAENERLRGKVDRLGERLSVLERIATDAPARLTAEIEGLR